MKGCRLISFGRHRRRTAARHNASTFLPELDVGTSVLECDADRVRLLVGPGCQVARTRAPLHWPISPTLILTLEANRPVPGGAQNCLGDVGRPTSRRHSIRHIPWRLELFGFLLRQFLLDRLGIRRNGGLVFRNTCRCHFFVNGRGMSDTVGRGGRNGKTERSGKYENHSHRPTPSFCGARPE